MKTFEVITLATTVIGALAVYVIKLERRIMKIKTELTWIKKIVDRRQEPRE